MPLTRIGRFEIQSTLGKGSMGEVYRARDPMLNRDVAIKVVRFPADLAPSHLAEMKTGLLKEARLAARLSHRGIVRVFDVGEENEQPFIVLELLAGSLLSEILAKTGPLEIEYAARIEHELLLAMAYAHERGIVHLDLKPSNIMLEPDGQPRVMDFGIARTFADLRLPGAGLSGTPRYMAPEQILGRPVDPRADVFALGVIFYYMLSGRVPFPQTDLQQLRRAIAEEPHPLLQTFRPNLPGPYYEFVDRALSKDPRTRHSSAGAMLESFLACRGQTSAPDRAAASAAPALASDKGRQEVLSFILQRIQRKGDFPAVSQYVAEVVKATRSRSSSAQTIAECILKDFALTNRVLRLANSAYYQGKGGQITTISRAVVVLGMDAVLNLASALGIFEHFLRRSDVRQLKQQVLQALFTAFNARAIANQIGFDNSEEPFICGMLHHLGRLIVGFYFPEEQKAIEEIVGQGVRTEEEASRTVMRLSYLELGQSIAESWGLPKLLQAGLTGLPPEHKGPLRGKLEMIQGIASYAHELGKATLITDAAEREIAMANVARQFEERIPIKPQSLRRIVEASVDDASNISNALKVSLRELGILSKTERVEPADRVTAPREASSLSPAPPLEIAPAAAERSSAPAEAVPAPAASAPEPLSAPGVAPGAEPSAQLDETASGAERQEFLTRIIGDIAMTLTGSFEIGDIMMMVLEGMYRGLGFRNVLLALVTPKHDRLAFRFGLGPNTEGLRTIFSYPLTSTTCAPVSCVLEKREIVLPDFEPAMADPAFPESLIQLLQPRSIVLLPVVVQEIALGLFFATRSQEQQPVSAQAVQSARMLVTHAVLAVHHAVGRK